MILRLAPWREAATAAQVASISIALAAPTVHAAPSAKEAAAPATHDEDETARPREVSTEAAPAVEAPEPSDTTVVAPKAVKSPGQATLDAAWEGVKDYDVRIVLDDGTSYTGRVSAVQESTFTLIDYQGGIVRVIPKATVRDLRVRVPGYQPPAQPLPEQTGAGMLAGGILLTVVGTPVFISGLVFTGAGTGASEIYLPMLLLGGGAVGAGIPLLVAGARRRRAYNKALYERTRPTPTLGFSRHGWTAGLSVRF